VKLLVVALIVVRWLTAAGAAGAVRLDDPPVVATAAAPDTPRVLDQFWQWQLNDVQHHLAAVHIGLVLNSSEMQRATVDLAAVTRAIRAYSDCRRTRINACKYQSPNQP